MVKISSSYIKFLTISLVSTFVLSCKADNDIARTIYNSFKVEHNFTIYEKSLGTDEPNYNVYTKPKILIQAVTPVKCENSGTGNDYKESISSCTLLKPLPKDLTLRYGKWLTPEEEEKQFPEPPYFEYRAKEPNPANYKDYEAWANATKKYWQQVEQLPQFKAYKQARQKSIDNIQWRTITIHPQAIMDKYRDKIPYEEVTSFSRNLPYLHSTELTLFITVNPDMSVTLTEDYHYQQSGKSSFH